MLLLFYKHVTIHLTIELSIRIILHTERAKTKDEFTYMYKVYINIVKNIGFDNLMT